MVETQKDLKKTKNKCLAIIYDGIINNKPVNFNKMRMPNKLRMYVENTYKRAKKVQKTENKNDLALALVLLFSKIQYDYKATAIINAYVRNVDEEAKKVILADMLKDTSKPFYMASWHKDSAADHKDWQGKLYYDARATGEALEYAEQHNLRTLQWVTGKPVWFVTRPYCRHYFVQYSLDEVKRGVKPRTRKIGDRALQTPARVTLNYYLDRLQQLEGLYRVFAIPKLKLQIDKTKLLIKKWQKSI